MDISWVTHAAFQGFKVGALRLELNKGNQAIASRWQSDLGWQSDLA